MSEFDPFADLAVISSTLAVEETWFDPVSIVSSGSGPSPIMKGAPSHVPWSPASFSAVGAPSAASALAAK